MVLDGLYMSLIGLSVVFMVLIVLLVTINILNYFDKKSANSVIEEISPNVQKEPKDSLENIAASIALTLALLDNKSSRTHASKSNFGSSNWLSNGQQRLFKSREV
jgi:Na+-transporting methylmalonyl-CoA/oxaloacetate decarboxylase gamma subunit